ncbi:1-phosphatidylinositol-3-phosphate 5-kinase [Grosmannia clavigera kw1407]|uniref:Mitochondrial distribution and morphology protein 12 n=1 Tax=Grosmannia clavigera (strain kw1407 / UAMH 11150) TaxID=655863 RepID=F0XSA2_GROCL|nr:1-phosphatidylinositol-3-phosphate 5-kinase [Grosmannia clavigera kw1407]EFW99517.1 1-phosphatidylinositol-3-phosphate 5-kinase [Grosmannia clavigera kw1407]
MSSSRMPPQSPASPSPHFERLSRRGSIASQSTTSQADKEQLAQALDKIHNSASQSDILTTFNDFGPPPTAAAPVVEPKGTASDLVQQGLSGFYSRLKEAVGVGGKATATELEGGTSHDGVPSKNSTRPTHTRSKSSVSSLPRGESGSTNTTVNSILSEIPTIAANTSGGITSDKALPSSKASSITTSTSASTAKSATATQSLSKVGRAPAPAVVDTAIASGAVGLYSEPLRDPGGPRTSEELASPTNGRRRPARLNESHVPSYSAGSNTYDGPTERKSNDIPGVASASLRSAKDDGPSQCSYPDAIHSPVKSTGPYRTSNHNGANPLSVIGVHGASAKLHDDLKSPSAINQLNVGGTPGGFHPLSSASERTFVEASPITTSAHIMVNHDSFAHDTRPQKLPSGQVRINGTTATDGTSESVSARLELMRKQILGKEFWMADETCKECFQCGDPFYAFRRKHHCRTCGWIFDSKCTSTISGEKFGVPGSLKVCMKCLDVINSRYEGGSDDSGDDDPRLTSLLQSNTQKSTAATAKLKTDDERSMSERTDEIDDGRSTTTPMMAIPAARRLGDPSNRNSAILEIGASQLSRPSSSRSLKSMASVRPTSSGHVRHHSKHNLLWNSKSTAEDRVPFRKDLSDEMNRRSKLPAFHDDNIIDPELAPYMSDESSGDEQMGLFSTLASKDMISSSIDPERSNFGPFLSVGRKHRSRQGEKSISGLSFTSRGVDDGVGSPSVASHSRATGRRRNMSSASIAAGQHHLRSPRSKLGGYKGPSISNETLSMLDVFGSIDAKAARPSTAKSEPTKLNEPSIKHTRKLFRQLLDDAAIPNPLAWEKALIPILRRCAAEVDPNTREGDRMDIRHYVKLKKIPGGKPSDSSYVSGVIFTKNLALKSMPRRIANPRILIVSFPVEYQRQQEHQFMSLEPVMSQEKEFLKMVVARIRSHEPEVVLAQRNVAGLALQSLAEAGIAVAYNVKPSVIGAVSRFTGTPIISSMDMLSLPITVGRCAAFEVKTFVNNDIPGRKKTYIFVSGCKKFLGCTIALRGTSTELLSRMKKITEFMVYVVYNLKLESCLLNDKSVKTSYDIESTSLPSATKQPPTVESLLSVDGPENPSQETPITTTTDVDADPLAMARSGPISMGHAETCLLADGEQSRQLSESTISAESLQGTGDRQLPEDVPAPTFYSDMVEKYKTKILSASPFVKFTQPYLLVKAREQETRLLYLKRLRDQDIHEEKGGSEDNTPQQQFQLINPKMVHEIGQKAPRLVMEVLHAVHDAEYDKALYAYQTQTRQWENYLQVNLDLFDPHSHQNIVVLYSVTCTETKIPCTEPGLVGFSYYNEVDDPLSAMSPDATLGMYIQDLCDGAEALCNANGCDRPLWQHHHTYVHGEARVTVFVEPEARLPSSPEPPSEKEELGEDEEDPIYVWSYCKICRRDLRVKRLSESGWKYSFGKYLELLFWNQFLRLDEDTKCLHDCHKEHIHYFNYRGSSVRIHYDPIDLLEVVVPRARITWKVDHDLKLKNTIFLKMQERWVRFITSLNNRIKSIRIDSVLPEKVESCKAEVERLAKKAQEDHPRLIRELQQAYMQSKHYEIIPLNAAMRSMALKITEWDATFAKFEADFLSDKDVRQLTVMQLRKMFTDSESKESLPAIDGTSVASLVSESENKSSVVPTTQSSVGGTDSKPEEYSALSTVEEPAILAGAAVTTKSPLEAEGERAPEQLVEAELELASSERQADEAPGQVEAPEATAQTSPTLTKTSIEMEASTCDSEVAAVDAADAADEVETSAGAAVVDGSRKSMSTSSSQELPGKSTGRTSSPASSSVMTGSSRPNKSGRPGPGQMSPQTLTEKVEQLRREFKSQSAEGSQTTQMSGNNSSQARHAADYRGASRKTGSKVSPPMIRTASQPVGAVPRINSGLSRQASVKDAKALTSEGGQSGNGGEAQKHAMDVLGKVDKKFTDRIGLSALKSHRKPGQSAIPRFVHKKKETKVTNLAKQLTREFEKERNRERMRAAKMQHQPQSYFPRSSVRAIVEVYEDINQAVQEPEPTDGEQLFASQHSEGRPEDKHPETGEMGEAGLGPAATAAPRTDEVDVADQSGQPSSEPRSQQLSESTAETAATEDQDHEHKHTESAAGSDGEGGSDADQSLEDILPDVETIAEHLEPSGTVPAELQKDKKSTLMKMLGNFWAERSATGWPPLDYPLNASDHIFFDSDVIVREDEPSSLIAFALSSEDYISKLRVIQQQGRKATRRQMKEAKAASGDSADGSDEGDGAVLEMKQSKGSANVAGAQVSEGGKAEQTKKEDDEDDEATSSESEAWYEMDEKELELSLLRSMGTHLKYQFTEGSARMMCKIFYAEQFDALRRKCGVADRIVESLSRCLKWDSKGGKTKSVFLKTLDDRLVMKALSPVETAAFLRFAPSYFSLMAEFLFHDLPSVIAKMLGFFQVIVKNSSTGTEIKLDLLIMENLFYDRQETRKFDLKGSMRNRKIQSTGEQNEVLLDENMVEYIYESPLFAREHAKKQLRASVWNDTLFLARQNVMDYSLMVAVDESRKELVVGIIDCIRTYTWDKKLESWIKDRGFAGGGRNRPTVTSPKEYKSRFREAMERYILQAPNCWHLFGSMGYTHPALVPRAHFEGRQNTPPKHKPCGNQQKRQAGQALRVHMSIDLNWDTLTTGPDGVELAERIRDFIHSKFQAVPLPRFIKSVTVHEFEFGSIAPELELKDITDPLPDFYEESEEDEDEDEYEDDSSRSRSSSSADEQREQREQKEERGHRHELSDSSLLSDATEQVTADARNSGGIAAAASATASGGVPGGTSNLLHHFHSHLAPGWSGTQTPLAAMAGAHLGGRPKHRRNPSYSSSVSMGGPDSVPAAAVATSSSSSYSSAANPALLRPVLREKHSVSTLAPTSSGIPSRPPTRDAAMAGLSGSGGSAAAEETAGGKGRRAEKTEQTKQTDHTDHTEEPRRPHAHRPHEPRAEDMQAVFRIRYAGDIKLLLTADILLDYPMPSFVGIPVRLSITGLTFDGVGVLAHIRKRIHFCFLGPEDALAAVGDDESDGISGCDGGDAAAGEDDSNMDDSGGDRATLSSARFTLHGAAAPTQSQPPPPAAAPPKPRTRVGGLLQEVRVESEIGQRQGGKQSLKNVGKVERFVLEQVRRIFEEEFVYPSFWTFLV